MKTCRCGAAVGPEDRYCSDCGSDVGKREIVKAKCPFPSEDGNTCNNEVFENQKFCQQCGHKLPASLFTAIVPALQICHAMGDDGKVCETELQPGTKFCPECGTKTLGMSSLSATGTTGGVTHIFSDKTLSTSQQLSDMKESSLTRDQTEQARTHSVSQSHNANSTGGDDTGQQREQSSPVDSHPLQANPQMSRSSQKPQSSLPRDRCLMSSETLTESLTESRSVSAIASAPSPEKQAHVEEYTALAQDEGNYKKTIIFARAKEVRELEACYIDHLQELYFLQKGGDLMDYLAWRKCSASQVLRFLESNRLDSEEQDDKTLPIETCTSSFEVNMTSDDCSKTPSSCSSSPVTSLRTSTPNSKLPTAGRKGEVRASQMKEMINSSPSGATYVTSPLSGSPSGQVKLKLIMPPSASQQSVKINFDDDDLGEIYSQDSESDLGMQICEQGISGLVHYECSSLSAKESSDMTEMISIQLSTTDSELSEREDNTGLGPGEGNTRPTSTKSAVCVSGPSDVPNSPSPEGMDSDHTTILQATLDGEPYEVGKQIVNRTESLRDQTLSPGSSDCCVTRVENSDGKGLEQSAEESSDCRITAVVNSDGQMLGHSTPGAEKQRNSETTTSTRPIDKTSSPATPNKPEGSKTEQDDICLPSPDTPGKPHKPERNTEHRNASQAPPSEISTSEKEHLLADHENKQVHQVRSTASKAPKKQGSVSSEGEGQHHDSEIKSLAVQLGPDSDPLLDSTAPNDCDQDGVVTRVTKACTETVDKEKDVEETGEASDEEGQKSDESEEEQENKDGKSGKGKGKPKVKSKSKQERVRKREKKKIPVKNAATDPSDKAENQKEKEPNVRTGETTKGPDAGASKRRLRSDDVIEVTFHVLFLPEMDTDNACIVFGHPHLGDWKKHRQLTCEEVLDDGFSKMRVTVPIPRQLTSSTLKYKYIHVDVDEKVTWEKLRRYGRFNDDLNRDFRIPDTHRKHGTWHQYDGIAWMQLKDGFWKKIVNTFKGKTMDDRYYEGLQRSIDVFLPNVEDGNLNELTGHELLDRMLCAFQCFLKQCLDNSRMFTDEDKFGQLLHGWVYRNVNSLKKTDMGPELRIVTAIIIVFVVDHYKVQVDKIDANSIFEGLLFHPNILTKCCPEWNAVEKHFKNCKLEVFNAVRSLCMRCSTRSYCDVHWLYAVPLLHFLNEDIVPWSDVKMTKKHNDKQPSWWGIDYLGNDVAKTKDFILQHQKLDSVVEEVVLNLRRIFGMDQLLPRTVMAIMSPRHLPTYVVGKGFPLKVGIATIFYHMSATYWSWLTEAKKTFGKDCLAAVDLITDNLESMGSILEGVESAEDIKRSCRQGSEEMCTIAYDLFCYIMKSYWQVAISSVNSIARLQIACLDNWAEVLADEEVNESTKNSGQTLQSNMQVSMQKIYYWLTSRDWQHDIKFVTKLKMRNNLLSLSLRNQDIQLQWQQFITQNLECCLMQVVSDDEVVSFYCENGENDISSFHQTVQDCLSQRAFTAMERILHSIGPETIITTRGKRFGDLLSKLFTKDWPQQESNILQHVVNWTPFPYFVHLFYGRDSKGDFLTEECKVKLVSAISLLETLKKEILTGSVFVWKVRLLGNPTTKMKIKRILQAIEDAVKTEDVGCHTKCLETVQCTFEVLEYRLREVGEYDTRRREIGTFLSLCERLPHVNTDVLIRKCRKEVDRCIIEDICTPKMAHDITEEYCPDITLFNLSPELSSALREIPDYSNSVIFLLLWEKYGRKAGMPKSLGVDEIVGSVWSPAKKDWNDLKDKLIKGTISFADVSNFLVHSNFGSEEKLKAELVLMNINKDDKLVEERLRQVKQYFTLKRHVESAGIILNLRDKLHLTGDFSPMEIICSANNENPQGQLKSMDMSLEQSTKILKDMDDQKQHCLFEFTKCKALVEWLGKEVKDQKELKVFVDLASISAGEGDMENAKVSVLHSATTGYAPLLFNLPTTIGCKEFLKKCEEVWTALIADPNLPKKLYDLNRDIKWLEMVKASHGSVEVTSLSQAETINRKGIYRVGRIDKAKTDKQKSLENVITLTIPDEDKTRNYDYSQLHDLQSRLMLVAGQAEKGKDEVVNFTEVLDSVTRLATVYLKLCAAGNIFFYNWKATLFCQRGRDTNILVDFGQKNLQLKGAKGDVNMQIMELASFMESCLGEWLRYYEIQRSEYYQLNHFTIEQLVILQEELVKVGTEEKPLDLVFPLLSGVKPDCNQRDLSQAMEHALRTVQRVDEGRQNTEQVEEEKKEVKLETVRSKFIFDVVKAGYSDKLALRALEEGLDPEDSQEGIVWCIENADEYSEDEDEGSSVDVHEQTSKFQGWSSTLDSIQTVTETVVQAIQRQRVKVLHEAMNQVWQMFLERVSCSLSNYLSVEHLGIILSELANLDIIECKRPFPSVFKQGKPNLIVCPQAIILNVALSLYMVSTDQQLPTTAEVLLCTQDTSIDQVDIFWRRAVFDNSQRIYCLVNADKLDYTVSDKAERKLEEYIHRQTRDDNYQLVVLCSNENEQRSPIVTALDKYRRPLFVTPSLNHLRNHVEKKLKNSEQNAASSVDLSGCTVRVIRSTRAGVGKTLFKKRLEETLKKVYPSCNTKDSVRTIPLHGKSVNISTVVEKLLPLTQTHGKRNPRIIHFDIAHEVQEGVDYLLFNLLILGSVQNSDGFVWRKTAHDLYLIETLPLLFQENNHEGVRCAHTTLDLLPHVTCRSPKESLAILQGQRKPADFTEKDRLFDGVEFKSPIFQRPYQYLRRMTSKFDDVNVNVPEGDMIDCLQVLLRHCGIPDPSWSELRHFVWFLNVQLQDCESSVFCGVGAAEDLPGFLRFVVRFMINMSRDFATRSLEMSEETPTLGETETENIEDGEEILAQYQMRRTWESSPHPYIFFNPDHNSMTFLGFNIVGKQGDMVDPQTGTVLEAAIMPHQLQHALISNKVPLTENFDKLSRDQKIIKLCRVMGIEDIYDPDETYELTTDNVKKMLAIYMRFRCGIPVIVMGETGCGKTRLVKFMCSLQTPPGVEGVPNMVLMKVHGGTRPKDIKTKVHEAEKKARENCTLYGSDMYTVLFFDEANTTDAIGLIKEVMCDGTMDGERLDLCRNLKIVAACNPYRKHSDEMIKRLEQAGLGYHVDAGKTTDRLGHVPMRRLVYRVQPLPQSLLPLVWDFGQLDSRVEKMYIQQMVIRCVRNEELPDEPGLSDVVSNILIQSQNFMREQKNECSFVSLRDVERTLQVMGWFLNQGNDTDLFELMDEKSEDEKSEEDSEYETDEDEEGPAKECTDLTEVTRALVLALGACYHACLSNRDEYRTRVAQFFQGPCLLPGGPNKLLHEINCCQEVFLDQMQVGENIAKNQALKENVFMMVICIELRLPLFLVGKPGSSKSLAKTIVADAMQGSAAHGDLFKQFKQVQMVSFQCSPLSAADGIVGTFRQCSQFQKDKDLDKFVSVVVLDEVGLAEDSIKMPLKTLHPLLEDGCQGDEKPEAHRKVAFIGISNWALDPAKMNRGIFVQRDVPDEDELRESAEGICSTEKSVFHEIKPIISALTGAYLSLFREATRRRREFFGLRDFYSLLKMLYGFVKKSEHKPSWYQLQHAILRNFGGLDGINPVEYFQEKFHEKAIIETSRGPDANDPDCSAAGLIQACLFEETVDSESRYLLLLTENYGALSILQQQILTMRTRGRAAITIFGSSFPKDQEYTQICRNINRIKICMETGNTVILLNLENLYESLYDALNQYYVYLGGERFVDLGLGTHRVKCRVHKEFRLVVVAEKDVVYEKFPIPLINRLEKHFLTVETILNDYQLKLAKQLHGWAEEFASLDTLQQNRTRTRADLLPGDVFIGYHADTAAAVILYVWKKVLALQENLTEEMMYQRVLEEAKEALLWSATPDAVCRLKNSRLNPRLITRLYFHQQKHENLAEYLHLMIVGQESTGLLSQVTTHSKLLSVADLKVLELLVHIPRKNIVLKSLQSFDTEQQFCRETREFLTGSSDDRLLLVQCDSGDQNGNLVASSRYSIMDEITQHVEKTKGTFHIAFLVQLPRAAGGCFSGFQIGRWQSVHIDDLRPVDKNMPSIAELWHQSVGELLSQRTEPVPHGATGPQHPSINNLLADNLEEGADMEVSDHVRLRPDTAVSVHEAHGLHPVNNAASQKELAEMEIRGQDPDQTLHEPQLHHSGNMLLDTLEHAVTDMEVRDHVRLRPDTAVSVHEAHGLHPVNNAASQKELAEMEIRGQDPDQTLHEPQLHHSGNMLLDTLEHAVTDMEVSVYGNEASRDTVAMEEEPMELEDVTVTVDEATGLRTARTKVDPLVFIYNCIHAAAAMIKDDDDKHNRATTRVQLLFQLLEGAGMEDLSFSIVLVERLVQLMKIKEDKIISMHMAQQWLSTEASKPDTISRAGTFRRSWMQCIESKIKPLLAGIIAFVDTNNNLDLLSESGGWKREVWLRLFSDPRVTPLDYQELLSPAKKIELKEIYAKLFGFGVTLSQPNMPFSWIIIDHVRKLFKSNKDMEDEDVVVRLLADSGLGNTLRSVSDLQDKDDLLSCYIKDFVSLIQPSQNIQEHKLLCEAIIKSAREKDSPLQPEDDLVKSIIVVHQTYEGIRGHLQLFSAVAQAWPDCSSHIREFEVASPNHMMNYPNIMLLDLVSVLLLLETLHPGKDQMATSAGKKEWLGRVTTLKPLVERLCQSGTVEDTHSDDQELTRRDTAMVTVCNGWNRTLVLKLFIEHVCPPDTKGAEHLQFLKCLPLWGLLGEGTNFKQIASLEALEKFLMSCNRSAVKHYFGKLGKCEHCNSKMTSVPMLLPCNHVLCMDCVQAVVLSEQECPLCQTRVQSVATLKKATDDLKSLTAYSEYQQRCNGFFMAAVAQLCFANDTPPESDVVQKLLGFVTMKSKSGHVHTRAISVFEDCIDPSPVVRSFLLQLLLRTSSSGDISRYIDTFFEQAKEIVTEQRGRESEDYRAHLVDLSLLITQCLEDSYHSEFCSIDKDGDISEGDCYTYVVRLLRLGRKTLSGLGLGMIKLQSIAIARFGLSVTARMLHEVYVTQTRDRESVKAIFHAARSLCENSGTTWPWMYLMKEVFRAFGSNSFEEMRRHQSLSWMIPDNLQERAGHQECPDHYISCGPEYKQLRNALAGVVMAGDTQQLVQLIQECNTQRITPWLCLAIHREVTMSHVRRLEDRNISCIPEVHQAVIDVCTAAVPARDQEFVRRLFANGLASHCQRLRMEQGQSLRQQSIVSLIVHFMVVINNSTDNHLLQPLVCLAQAPDRMMNTFLPTMPEDHLTEIHNALLAGRGAASNENPSMYRCPNGHLYMIGDCGRPTVTDRCRTCGLMIGGTGHTSAEGNIKVTDTSVDSSARGHILGAAQTRSHQAIPERDLNLVCCTLVRLLTHLSMYIGANDHPQVIASMIQPDVGQLTVPDFLWDHLEFDLGTVQATLGKGFDDVLGMLHHLLNYIFTHHVPGSGHQHSWNQKPGRREWERQFGTTYLSPLLANLEDTINRLNQTLLNDERLGNMKLLKMVYETDIPEVNVDFDRLQEVPAFWRYRSRISLGHLEQVFSQQENTTAQQSQQDRFKVLQLFLKEDHHIRALQYLPSILKLQSLLIHKFQRRIDFSEAASMELHTFLEDLDKHTRGDYERLLHDLHDAWECVREAVPKSGYPSEKGNVFVPREYCQQSITMQTHLSMLLPSLRDQGLCAYGLVYFLLTKQNEFLLEYYTIKGKADSVETVRFPSASAVTVAHLVNYHPDKDILPLILANCNYSFEVGKGTKIEYDFISFQRQLENRFFEGKPIISVEQVDVLTFRADVTNASVFKILQDKIPQVSVSRGIRQQISHDLKGLPDVCDTLANVDIVTSFLVSAPRTSTDSLEDFMVNTLRMKTPLVSLQAKKHCQLRHVQSLWLHLSLEKLRRLTKYGQNGFEAFGAEFKTDLTEDQTGKLSVYLDRLKGDKLEIFLQELHDCLLLRIMVSQDQTADDFVEVEQTRLKDMLVGHLDSPLYEEEGTAVLNPPVLYLDMFPEDVLCKQVVPVLLEALHRTSLSGRRILTGRV